jgi:hypothetical protein
VDSLRSYFRDYQELPGILAIQETQFSTLPDGRKVPQENPVVNQGIVTADGVVWPWANGVMAWLSEPEGFIAAENFLKNQLAQEPPKASSPRKSP